MKLQYKHQQYQADAVAAVVDCFRGQLKPADSKYRVIQGATAQEAVQHQELFAIDYKNHPLTIEDRLLENVQAVQRKDRSLDISSDLNKDMGTYNFDIEMETGTGKTYVYIKTMFELHRQYGWGKFIVVVPSIAIREGVYKSFQSTADHFCNEAEVEGENKGYGEKSNFFIYNSKNIQNLKDFTNNPGIQVMIINVQAFAARGQDARRIHEAMEDFQYQSPMDVIAANRPILILDEPQKMEGDVTQRRLQDFKPLFTLRYSATHRNIRTQIYRLDALAAYNQKLVKKIVVKGINVRPIGGAEAYFYLQDVFPRSGQKPAARLELEVKQASGTVTRKTMVVEANKKVFEISKGLQAYEGYVIEDINVTEGTLTFSNGVVLYAGDACGDVSLNARRRIQIRETIASHLELEKDLYAKGIKTLSLFFIDAVDKYRQYLDGEAVQGEYAKIFEEEYANLIKERCEATSQSLAAQAYLDYLNKIDVKATHNGYFSIDKHKHMVDPKTERSGDKLANDADAYDLILKDKERLLSLQEPTRFIFSHSALREGWDNPNVFIICTLKHSNNTISRRQEVGRGLRLCVNQAGERMDGSMCTDVHDLNRLTVVTDESYENFVKGIQDEMIREIAPRTLNIDINYFTDKILVDNERITPDKSTAIYQYLVRSGYIDETNTILSKYTEDRKANACPPLPESLSQHAERIYELIDNAATGAKCPAIENERLIVKNSKTANFSKKEFMELWHKINHKAVYAVDFDSNELINAAIESINKHLEVLEASYTVAVAEQAKHLEYRALTEHDAFKTAEHYTRRLSTMPSSSVPYDVIGRIADAAVLTRKTVAAILKGINNEKFDLYKNNPEEFIEKVSSLVKEEKAAKVIERLVYHPLSDTFSEDIFTESQINIKQAFEPSKSAVKYIVCDSQIEKKFMEELDSSSDVCVYTKLPRGFYVPTPIEDYHPDWAIAFNAGAVRHVYFVAETKGAMNSMQLRKIEDSKIECAKKFFASIATDKVKYDVVTSYDDLMRKVFPKHGCIYEA